MIIKEYIKVNKIFNIHNTAKIAANFFSGFVNLVYFIEKRSKIKVKIVPDKQQ